MIALNTTAHIAYKTKATLYTFYYWSASVIQDALLALCILYNPIFPFKNLSFHFQNKLFLRVCWCFQILLAKQSLIKALLHLSKVRLKQVKIMHIQNILIIWVSPERPRYGRVLITLWNASFLIQWFQSFLVQLTIESNSVEWQTITLPCAWAENPMKMKMVLKTIYWGHRQVFGVRLEQKQHLR